MMEPYAFKVCMDRADLKYDQNNQKPHWIEWLAHTNFSFLHGASHPSELLDAADANRSTRSLVFETLAP